MGAAFKVLVEPLLLNSAVGLTICTPALTCVPSSNSAIPAGLNQTVEASSALAAAPA